MISLKTHREDSHGINLPYCRKLCKARRRLARPKFRRSVKKIRDFEAFMREVIKGLDSRGGDYISREGLANEYGISLNIASKAMHELGKRGVVYTRPINNPPHDSNRDKWGGGFSSWICSRWQVRKRDRCTGD